MPATPGAAIDTRKRELDQVAVPLARLLAVVGLVGAAVVVALFVVLHFLPQTSGISPISRTISEYALTDVGHELIPVINTIVKVGTKLRDSESTSLQRPR